MRRKIVKYGGPPTNFVSNQIWKYRPSVSETWEAVAFGILDQFSVFSKNDILDLYAKIPRKSSIKGVSKIPSRLNYSNLVSEFIPNLAFTKINIMN